MAAASAEARAAGVRAGQPLAARARALPRRGRSGPATSTRTRRVSDDVTAILLAASRRVERPSADEAYVDLTPRLAGGASPVPAAEGIKDELQRRLGLDASLGLASIAARRARRVDLGPAARPPGRAARLRGLVPGPPARLLPRRPAAAPRSRARAGGHHDARRAARAPTSRRWPTPSAATAAPRLRLAARGEDEEPIAVAAPPAWIQEEVADPRPAHRPRPLLEDVLEGLAGARCRRLRPFDLAPGLSPSRSDAPSDDRPPRATTSSPARADEETARLRGARLAEPLLEPAAAVRSMLGAPQPPLAAVPQSSLFPDVPSPASRSGGSVDPPFEPVAAPPALRRCTALVLKTMQDRRRRDRSADGARPRVIASDAIRPRAGGPSMRRVQLDPRPRSGTAPCASSTSSSRRIPKPPARSTTGTLELAGRHDPLRPVHGRAREPWSRPRSSGRYPDARRAGAGAAARSVEAIIRSTGFFRAKAKSLLGCARASWSGTAARSPARMDALVKLPGVGRKTANVVLGHAYEHRTRASPWTPTSSASRTGSASRARDDPDRGRARSSWQLIPQRALDAHHRPAHLPRPEDLRRAPARAAASCPVFALCRWRAPPGVAWARRGRSLPERAGREPRRREGAAA